MIKPFLYIVFLISFVSSAQNLVPNGSFEEYTQCPYENELGSNGQFERCKDWYYTTPVNVGTPDYFNSCNNTSGGMVGVPNNFWGYQNAFHGDGYIGLGMYEYSLSSNSVIGKEFVSTKLLSQLKPCLEYRFEMYISLANQASHGCSSIGVKFMNSDFSSNLLSDYLELEANWELQEIIVDTVNWVKISMNFIANGGEDILSIGHFSKYDENNTIFNDSLTIQVFNTYLPYYYIDSVSIFEVGSVNNCFPILSNVFSPNGDLINDHYSIQGLHISEMVILNRWGDVITILTEDYPIWDGMFEGKACTEGSYFYRAEFGTQTLTGFIELIR